MGSCPGYESPDPGVGCLNAEIKIAHPEDGVKVSESAAAAEMQPRGDCLEILVPVVRVAEAGGQVGHHEAEPEPARVAEGDRHAALVGGHALEAGFLQQVSISWMHDGAGGLPRPPRT